MRFGLVLALAISSVSGLQVRLFQRLPPLHCSRPDRSERHSWRRTKRNEVLRFAAPALSTVLADPLMSVVDALVVGRTASTLELASLGPALAVFNFVNYFFFFLSAATTVRVAAALSCSDEEAATTTLGVAVSVATLCGVFVTICLIAKGPDLVRATGCVAALVPAAARYLRVRALGSPFVLAAMVAQAGLLAQRDARTPLNAVTLACFLNVLGDFVLVPKIGAAGAAWATLVSQVVALPVMLWLSKKRGRLSVNLRLPTRAELGPLVSASKPLFVFETGMSICYGLIQAAGAQFTVGATAAFQSLWNPTSFLTFVTYPLKQAAAVFLPTLKPQETREFLTVLLNIAWPLGLVIAGAEALCAASPAAFTGDVALHATIRGFGPPVAAAALILPFAQVGEGTLLGTGDLGFLSRTQIMNVIVAAFAMVAVKRVGVGVKAKLDRTVAFLEAAQLSLRDSGEATNFNDLSDEDIYIDTKDLTAELHQLHHSLCSTGCSSVADGKLSDVIRNLYAFGLTLVPLDVRQESTRHTEALDCITRYLGVGSYQEWDELTRLSWLQKQLTNKRPLVRRGCWNSHGEFFNPAASEVLETFDVIAEAGSGTLGAYVISQASTASDVLAVLLLQRDAGVKSELRVVPLFETLDDLNGAVEVMDTLWSSSVYRGSINNKQEIMVGYSDSAKDAGRLAASWAQYETQEKLADLAKSHGIELTFFHGKGGTVGRGGNPATFEAILAHPPSTINGRFRLTEQGEMITQNFGHSKIAERTLDIYTAALLAEHHTPRSKPSPETRELMNKLSEISVSAYRKIVRSDPRFVPYFRAATPEVELSNLNIGSRPAKRKASGGVESLRAIPWIFAWTQTRLNLPTWLGVGEALSGVLSSDDGPALHAMYSEWSSFKTTIDLVEMVLAKSEPEIARIYEDQLVSDPEALELGKEIRRTHANTEKAVLELTGHKTLSEDNARLLRGMSVRNPYVDCLNVLQAEILLRLRRLEDVEGKEEEKKRLTDALMISINGVANGMKNTG